MPPETATETSGAAGAGATPQAIDLDSGADPFAFALSTIADPDEAAETSEDAEVAAGLDGDLESASEEREDKSKKKPTAEAEAEDKEKKPRKKTRAELEAFLLSPEQLATPAGLEKAQDYLRERSGNLDGFDIRIKKNARELAAERETFDTWRTAEESRLETDRVYARKLGSLRQKLEDPANMSELIEAIGTVCNRDGRDIYERWTKFVLAGGKRPDVTNGEQRALDRVQALEARVMSLVDELQNGGQAEQAAREEHELAALKPEVQRLEGEIIAAAADPEQYPALAPFTAIRSMRPHLLADYRRIRREAKASGEKLDRAATLARLDGELKRLVRAGATPASPRAGARPASPVTERVTSIAPSQSRNGGVHREMTEAELEEDLRRDPAQLEAWFGPMNQ